jgi:hypothetical protein
LWYASITAASTPAAQFAEHLFNYLMQACMLLQYADFRQNMAPSWFLSCVNKCRPHKVCLMFLLLLLLALTALTGFNVTSAVRCWCCCEWASSNIIAAELAATALACGCQQLQHLGRMRCGLDVDSMACLAAVRHLMQLTVMWLLNSSALLRHGLLLLTGLKWLHVLCVENNLGSATTVACVMGCGV